MKSTSVWLPKQLLINYFPQIHSASRVLTSNDHPAIRSLADDDPRIERFGPLILAASRLIEFVFDAERLNDTRNLEPGTGSRIPCC